MNDAELGPLQPERGIRQGDPIFPCLFIISFEFFSHLLSGLMNVGKLKGVGAFPHGQRLSHLLFADDTLLFGEATDEEVRHMKWAIDMYEAVSGQRINLEKSGVFFSPNTSQEVRTEICQLMGIPEVASHGKYLGLLSEIGRNKIEIFQTLKTRVRQRIDGWSEKHLSKAGKEF